MKIGELWDKINENCLNGIFYVKVNGKCCKINISGGKRKGFWLICKDYGIIFSKNDIAVEIKILDLHDLDTEVVLKDTLENVEDNLLNNYIKYAV